MYYQKKRKKYFKNKVKIAANFLQKLRIKSFYLKVVFCIVSKPIFLAFDTQENVKSILFEATLLRSSTCLGKCRDTL